MINLAHATVGWAHTNHGTFIPPSHYCQESWSTLALVASFPILSLWAAQDSGAGISPWSDLELWTTSWGLVCSRSHPHDRSQAVSWADVIRPGSSDQGGFGSITPAGGAPWSHPHNRVAYGFRSWAQGSSAFDDASFSRCHALGGRWTVEFSTFASLVLVGLPGKQDQGVGSRWLSPFRSIQLDSTWPSGAGTGNISGVGLPGPRQWQSFGNGCTCFDSCYCATNLFVRSNPLAFSCQRSRFRAAYGYGCK